MRDAINTSGYEYDELIFIGRMQIFHLAHESIVKKALSIAEKVIIVLGSSYRPRSVKHPFFAEEREATIRLALGADADRVEFVYMRDYYDNEKWGNNVSAAVGKLTASGGRAGIIGHEKDESSFYLHMFPQWEQVFVDNFGNINATDLRKLYFAKENREACHALLATRVGKPVAAFLAAFAQLPEYEKLCNTHAQLESDKKAWSGSPYPPIFVTVDSVVRCKDRILMIRRAGELGNDQWALPGGFLEQNDKLIAGALRELDEETQINVSAGFLRTKLFDQDVFDYPGRSERGRTITHAFFFDLGEMGLPDVVGASDAKIARWVPIADLAKMECLIFEDHLAIIDRFVSVM